MTSKKDSSKRVTTQLSLKEELLGSQIQEDLVVEKREIPVTIRMNARVVEILDALVELDIFDSRSEAIADIVETTISAKYKIFNSLKAQADDLKRRRDAARELASRVISGDID